MMLLLLALLTDPAVRRTADPGTNRAAVAASTNPRPVSSTLVTDDRQWFPLSSHPGYYGYGRLNAAGELVVEWHCYGRGGQVTRGPVPELFVAAPPNVPTSSLRVPTPVSAPAPFRYYYPSLSPCAGGN